MKHLKKLLFVGFVGVGAACGGDSDGGGSGRADTGLPPAQELGDVTPAEFERACNSVQASVDRRFSQERIDRLICELLGASFSNDAGTCRDVAADCIANPPAELEEVMTEDVAGMPELGCGEGPGAANFEGCTATVGEFETCINDALGLIDQFFEQFSCAHAGNVDLAALMDSGPLDEPPPSCVALDMECPGAGIGVEEPQ